MTAPKDPYASEAETRALLVPDTRTAAEKHIDGLLESLGANEQGVEPEGRFSLLRQIAVTLAEAATQSAPVQEPVAWKWYQAPVKTSWGHDMVVADLAIDKDNTVSVYCERDQTAKVEAMFTTPPAAPVQEPVATLFGSLPVYDTPPAAQRQWVEVDQVKWDGEKFIAKLKEKNT